MEKENKMGVMPVNKLLMNMSLPMMISMLVQALYNIVDSIFVAKLSEDALTAVSLAFPLQTLIIAVAAGTGVGVQSLLSKSLGEKNFEKANQTAMNGIFVYIISYIVFALAGLCVVRPFYASQLTDAQSNIMEMGVSYLTIVMVCSFGLFGQFIFEKLLQSTGKTFFTMISQSTGAIVNIILDPIMIFGLCGFPKMGVAGAAVATIIGQICGAALAFIFNMRSNHEITLSFKGFHPNGPIIAKIYEVGVPSIIMQAIGSVMTYGFNRILIVFSSTATAVFGVYFKLQSFFFMPVFGLNSGLIPIIAYNFGAAKRRRMIKTIKWSMLYAFVLLFLGFAAFMLIPEKLFMMFDASEEMLKIGVPALRIISIHFLIAWFCIIAGSTFQAVGNGFYSLIVSVARQLVVLLPAAYLLAKFGGLHAVWWSFPIAEFMSLIVSVICLYLTYTKVISKIPDQE